MTTRADEEPIRLLPDRIQKLKDRMRAASMERSALPIDPEQLEEGEWEQPEKDEAEQLWIEYEARCAAREIVHEHLAYDLERGAEWELAMSVLDRPFDGDEYNFEDQLGNSMLGLDSLLERRHKGTSGADRQ